MFATRLRDAVAASMSSSETADSGVGRCEIFRHRGDVSVALTAAEDLRFGVVFDTCLPLGGLQLL